MKRLLEPIDYREHAADVLARATELAQAGTRFALITSIDIKGGSARETGALAVVSAAGQMTGYLSNGCIDRDILHHGLATLETGKAEVLRYGEGSPFHDLRLPCGGSLTILVDPNPDVAALQAAASALAGRQETQLHFALPEGAGLSVRYSPKTMLALAGRGAIFRAMATLGDAAGFTLALYSPDESDLAAVGHLATGPVVHLTTPDQPPQLRLDPHCAALTLFHDHDWEPQFLMAALQTSAGYIGAMGSPRTQEGRLLTLQSMGAAPVELTRIRGPIGLVPSLRSAQLIAISALAEIAATFPSQQQVVAA